MIDEEGFVDKMNSIFKFVVLIILEKIEWNVNFIKGNIVEEILKLKE